VRLPLEQALSVLTLFLRVIEALMMGTAEQRHAVAAVYQQQSPSDLEVSSRRLSPRSSMVSPSLPLFLVLRKADFSAFTL
jgi:hypothetical protein